MRKSAMLMLALASMSAFGWTTASPSRAQSPIGMYGSWSSTQYAGSGGLIQLTDLSMSGDVFEGRIFFTGSPCAVWAVFSGRLYGDTSLLSMQVGPCGLTEISLHRQGNQWIGTYRSGLPRCRRGPDEAVAAALAPTGDRVGRISPAKPGAFRRPRNPAIGGMHCAFPPCACCLMA